MRRRMSTGSGRDCALTTSTERAIGTRRTNRPLPAQTPDEGPLGRLRGDELSYRARPWRGHGCPRPRGARRDMLVPLG
jgi:hypothetical protein